MVNVIVTSDPRYDINKGSIEIVVQNMLKAHKVTSSVEIEVVVVGDRKMHELNKKFRGLDTTTDILTFALEDPQQSSLQHVPQVGFISSPDQVLRLGSIIISYPQALDDAAVDGRALEDEISFLVEHGTRHLLGIHHE